MARTTDGREVELREPTPEDWRYILGHDSEDERLRRAQEKGLTPIVCPTCNGTGESKKPANALEHYRHGWKTALCQACAGEGRLFGFVKQQAGDSTEKEG